MAEYGASIGGVQGHLQQIDLDATSFPTVDQTDRWLTDIGDFVSAAIGPLVDPLTEDQQSLARNAARVVVELGVAAMAETAAWERTPRNAASRGPVLWDRYVESLKMLVESVNKLRADAAAGNPSGVGPVASGTFPDAWSGNPFIDGSLWRW